MPPTIAGRPSHPVYCVETDPISSCVGSQYQSHSVIKDALLAAHIAFAAIVWPKVDDGQNYLSRRAVDNLFHLLPLRSAGVIASAAFALSAGYAQRLTLRSPSAIMYLKHLAQLIDLVNGIAPTPTNALRV